MTLIEAINYIDALKPNTYTTQDKIKWLSLLDWQIKLNVLDKYEPDEEPELSDKMIIVDGSLGSDDDDTDDNSTTGSTGTTTTTTPGTTTGTTTSGTTSGTTSSTTTSGTTTDTDTDTEEEETEEEDTEFKGYNNLTPLNTELLVSSPYDEIYITWLESKIDYANSEYVKYNNSITRFNDMYREFINFYNRTHMPKGVGIRYY